MVDEKEDKFQPSGSFNNETRFLNSSKDLYDGGDDGRKGWRRILILFSFIECSLWAYWKSWGVEGGPFDGKFKRR